jgi:hypothetical protein
MIKFVFIGFTFGTPQYPSTDVPPRLSSLFRTCTFKGSNARKSFATEYGATSFPWNFKINEVKMTAATIQALRIMMQGKLANCFQDMEARITSNIGNLVKDLRTDFVEE